MKVNELVLAKCIANKETSLVLGQYYVVDAIYIGQSMSSVVIDGIHYNSIRFEYYDDKHNELDIYHSKYSPYFKKLEIPIEEYDFTKDPHVYAEEELEEDKEIELIPIEEFNISYNLGFVDYRKIEVLKDYLNKDFQTIYDTLDLLIKNQKKLSNAVNELKKGK